VVNRRDFIVMGAVLGSTGLSLGAFAQAPGAKPVILVVGDSLSAEYGLKRGEGWVPLLEKRLADQKIAGAQKGRREGRLFRILHQPGQRLHATRSPAHVHVVSASLLKGKTHEFAASLNGRPVIKLVAHRLPPGSLSRAKENAAAHESRRVILSANVQFVAKQ